MSSRLPLILDHWFREGPEPASGYWICAYRGCGRHRSDHFQAEGQWLDPVHAFTPQRIAPARCRTCGHHRRHSRHVPWRWDQYPVPARPGAASSPAGSRLSADRRRFGALAVRRGAGLRDIGEHSEG